MILQFAVTNYRSYRETVVFSMFASHIEKRGNGADAAAVIPGLKGERIVKGAAIFGGNASGKSNLIQALDALRDMIIGDAENAAGHLEYAYVPFMLDYSSRMAPTTFELDFMIKNVRYNYRVSYTKTRIEFEALTAYPRSRPQKWFKRESVGKGKKQRYKWDFSEHFDASDTKLQRRTEDAALFLSVAGRWNHPQLKPVRDFIQRDVVICAGLQRFSSDYTMNALENSVEKDRLVPLLRMADPGIMDVEAKSEKVSLEELRRKNPDMPAEIIALLNMQKDSATLRSLFYKMMGEDGGQFPVPREYASAGTERYLALIGPITDILAKGKVLIVDELEVSLHPMLVFEIVKWFLSKQNSTDAQLIFSTHLTTLLNAARSNSGDEPLLRRDQIWFTDKSREGISTLTPLTAFSPRKDEALERGYFAGRYGGIPLYTEGRNNHD